MSFSIKSSTGYSDADRAESETRKRYGNRAAFSVHVTDVNNYSDCIEGYATGEAPAKGSSWNKIYVRVLNASQSQIDAFKQKYPNAHEYDTFLVRPL